MRRRPDASTILGTVRRGNLRGDRRRELRPDGRGASAPATRWRVKEVRSSSCSLLFQGGECLPQLRQHAARLMDLAEPFFGDPEITFSFAAAFRRGIAKSGCDQAFCFETLERRVYAANRDGSATWSFEFPRDGNSVSFVTEMDHGEKEHQLKLPE